MTSTSRRGPARPHHLAARFGAPRWLAVAALWLAVASGASAQSLSPASATAFVDGTAKRLIAIIDSPESKASQTGQLQAVVDQSVDAEGIARFCLGRYWQSATPAQRQSFLGLFHAVLLEGVTGQLRAYKGVTVTLGRVQPRDADVSVSSVVQRPDQSPAAVDWLVESTPAGLRISDVVAEGTSLRLTRRNDYASFLSSHGGNIDALLTVMRQKLAQ